MLEFFIHNKLYRWICFKKKTEYDKIYFCHHIMFTTLGKLFFCSGLSAQGQNLGNEGNVQIS